MATEKPRLWLLRECYFDALERFIKNDLQLLATVAHEQAIAHRIAKYLEEEVRKANIDKRYVVDCEYNRNGNKVKMIVNKEYERIAIRADVILHSRGSILAQDNLLAIELKMLPAKEDEKERDRLRLMAMTVKNHEEEFEWNGGYLPKYVCGYKLGVYLLLDATAGKIYQEFYSDGEKRKSASEIDVSAEIEEIRAANNQG